MARKHQGPIDWYEVGRAIRKSFTGKGIDEYAQRLCVAANKADPERYRKLRASIREEERAILRSFGRGN